MEGVKSVLLNAHSVMQLRLEAKNAHCIYVVDSCFV